MKPILERECVFSGLQLGSYDRALGQSAELTIDTEHHGLMKLMLRPTPEERANLDRSIHDQHSYRCKLVLLADFTPVREELAELKARVAELERLLG